MTFPLHNAPTFGLNPQLFDDLRTHMDSASRPANASRSYAPGRTGDHEMDPMAGRRFMASPQAKPAEDEFLAAFATVQSFAKAHGLTLATAARANCARPP